MSDDILSKKSSSNSSSTPLSFESDVRTSDTIISVLSPTKRQKKPKLTFHVIGDEVQRSSESVVILEPQIVVDEVEAISNVLDILKRYSLRNDIVLDGRTQQLGIKRDRSIRSIDPQNNKGKELQVPQEIYSKVESTDSFSESHSDLMMFSGILREGSPERDVEWLQSTSNIYKNLAEKTSVNSRSDDVMDQYFSSLTGIKRDNFVEKRFETAKTLDTMESEKLIMFDLQRQDSFAEDDLRSSLTTDKDKQYGLFHKRSIIRYNKLFLPDIDGANFTTDLSISNPTEDLSIKGDESVTLKSLEKISIVIIIEIIDMIHFPQSFLRAVRSSQRKRRFKRSHSFFIANDNPKMTKTSIIHKNLRSIVPRSTKFSLSVIPRTGPCCKKDVSTSVTRGTVACPYTFGKLLLSPTYASKVAIKAERSLLFVPLKRELVER